VHLFLALKCDSYWQGNFSGFAENKLTSVKTGKYFFPKNLGVKIPCLTPGKLNLWESFGCLCAWLRWLSVGLVIERSLVRLSAGALPVREF